MPEENKPAPPKSKVKVKSAIEAITTDKHAGKSGSYIFDPTTGTRTPAPESATTKEDKE